MSELPVLVAPAPAPPPPPARGYETYQQKAARKFKEQPLVPLGAAATCVALVAATVRMRQGDRASFNHWLRARIVAQGLTVVAVVAGSYAYGQTRQQRAAAAQADAAARAQERAAFEERLRGAEEADSAERAMRGANEATAGLDWRRVWRGGGGEKA